ncbi:MAG: SGNH/GDSL hydrolase family protein, partial [Muribaculaceae bacterium]|nr:SGNH/GDSL hydrolase family protein [Muribaculaceae bacterium]
MTWLRNAITLLLFIVVSTGVGCNAGTRHDAHADQDVVLLGDSNTWLGGDDCTGVKGWGKWFAEEYRPGSIRSYARSGATWTNTVNTVADTREYSEVLGDNNVIYNQVMRLVEDFEADK